jgi:MFS family permease
LHLTRTGTSVTLDPASPAYAERNYRWNASLFMVDFLAFGIFMALLSQSTVLPSFVGQLTDSPLLIGLIATIQNGVWLLPQLVSAGLVSGKARKKPYLIVPALIGRPVYLILAAIVGVVGAENSTVLLVAFFAALTLYTICDGLCSVPWFDMLAKAVPADRRGRLVGGGQVLSGLVGIGLGIAIGWILTRPSLPFPRNYAVLFGLAGVALLVDLVILALIREPVLPTDGVRATSLLKYVSLLGPVLRKDRRFVRVVLVRLAFGVGTAIVPFYVVYAGKSLGFGGEQVGLFLSAQVLGGVVGGLVLGLAADHRGSGLSVKLAVVAAALVPALALVTHLAGKSFGPSLLYLTAAIFVAIGFALSSWFVGFLNYVLEIAPPADRATYTGLFNTLSGALLAVPLLAGWLAEAASYPVVFAVALAVILAGLVISLGLPPPSPRTG